MTWLVLERCLLPTPELDNACGLGKIQPTLSRHTLLIYSSSPLSARSTVCIITSSGEHNLGRPWATQSRRES